MKIVSSASQPTTLDGDTPTLRLFALREVIASKDQLFSLQVLVEATGLPKPTRHRMLQQLASADLLQREGDGRHYSTGVRLRRLAENLLMNDSHHGARHAVLRHLVEEIGESCNITTLSGRNSSSSMANPSRRTRFSSRSSLPRSVSVFGVKRSSSACASRRSRCAGVICARKILPLAEQCTGTREPGCR